MKAFKKFAGKSIAFSLLLGVTLSVIKIIEANAQPRTDSRACVTTRETPYRTVIECKGSGSLCSTVGDC